MSADTPRLLYQAADGIPANSGRQPFGLVGLETMAARGLPTLATRASNTPRHLENAVVLDTADPAEAACYVGYLDEHPETRRRLRDRHATLLGSLSRTACLSNGWPASRFSVSARGQASAETDDPH